jgi:hypothetical protein
MVKSKICALVSFKTGLSGFGEEVAWRHESSRTTERFIVLSVAAWRRGTTHWMSEHPGITANPVLKNCPLFYLCTSAPFVAPDEQVRDAVRK